jgi:DNA-binding beta-propeller fold protein YncE
MRPVLIKCFSSTLLALALTTSITFNGKAQKAGAGPPSASGYHLINRIEIGGEGGWDYLTVDAAARRLYVSRSTRVMVLDADTGKAVGEIAGTNGVHGVAIASDLGRGYTSNGRDGSVTIFDLQTLKILGQVKVGTNPDAIIYDPATRRVFAFNRGSSDVSAIEAADGKVAGLIALGGHPEFAASDGKGMVFVNLDDKSEVVALDSRKLEVKSRWPVAPGEDPSGMSIDRKQRRLFIGCANKKMIVMSADNGHVISALPIGSGVDATAFDPETNLAFSSNGDGSLTVVHEDSADKFRVVEDVPTERGTRTMALDTKTHRVFLATAKFGPPPAPTPERPNPRPTVVPGSFVILVFAK